jgi:hypothetical protein
LQKLKFVSSNGGRKFHSFEESKSHTYFSLARSEDKKDFLAINCHCENEVNFSSNRLIYQGGWLKKLLEPKGTIQFKTSIDKAESVIGDYFNLSRDEFEERYKAGYTNSSSLNFIEI